jgi:hypothetical protein
MKVAVGLQICGFDRPPDRLEDVETESVKAAAKSTSNALLQSDVGVFKLHGKDVYTVLGPDVIGKAIFTFQEVKE